MMLTAFGTTSLLACYNHVNKTACPKTYTDGNNSTCTLVDQTNPGTYDDPNDDGTGASGYQCEKKKYAGASGDCGPYNCAESGAISVYTLGQVADTSSAACN